jgi:hypothetical protein
LVFEARRFPKISRYFAEAWIIVAQQKYNEIYIPGLSLILLAKGVSHQFISSRIDTLQRCFLHFSHPFACGRPAIRMKLSCKSDPRLSEFSGCKA